MRSYEIEKGLVEAFFSPARRSRYVYTLTTKRGRDKLRRELAHFRHLDQRFARPVAKSSADAIEKVLRENGAPAKCYVFSESDGIDTLEMDLNAALQGVVGQGMGTILVCVPGRLAYYEGEEPGERYILQRP